MRKYSLFAYLSLLAVGCVGAPMDSDGSQEGAQDPAVGQLAQEQRNELPSAQVRQLVTDYYVDVRGLDLNNWLANFDKNATMEDPVGSGRIKGRDKLAGAYGQAVASFNVLDMREQDVFTPDKTNEAAVRWTATITFKNGLKVDAFNGITNLKFNKDGKICDLRAFYDPSVLLNAHF